jgi:hypothetical protein
MSRYLIIVSRNRPNLFQHLCERHSTNATVLLDRRKIPRQEKPTAGLWHTHLERDGYVVLFAK